MEIIKKKQSQRKVSTFAFGSHYSSNTFHQFHLQNIRILRFSLCHVIQLELWRRGETVSASQPQRSHNATASITSTAKRFSRTLPYISRGIIAIPGQREEGLRFQNKRQEADISALNLQEIKKILVDNLNKL